MRHAEKLDHHQPNRDLVIHPLQELTAAPQPTSFSLSMWPISRSPFGTIEARLH